MKLKDEENNEIFFNNNPFPWKCVLRRSTKWLWHVPASRRDICETVAKPEKKIVYVQSSAYFLARKPHFYYELFFKLDI